MPNRSNQKVLRGLITDRIDRFRSKPKTRVVTRTRRRLATELLEDRRLLAASFGVNLVIDPSFEVLGFEQSNGLPGSTPWYAQLENPFIRQYGGDSVPSVLDKPSTVEGPSAGDFLLYGGDQGASANRQRIDLTDYALLIDSGIVYADISAWIGGWAHQNDSGSFAVFWEDVNGNPIGTPTGTGTVSAGARGGHTVLLYRSQQGIEVPTNTRYAQVEARMDRASGGDNDGTVDAVSLQLTIGNAHDSVGVIDQNLNFGQAGVLNLPVGSSQTYNREIVAGELLVSGNGAATFNSSVQAGSLRLELPSNPASGQPGVIFSSTSSINVNNLNLPANGSLAINGAMISGPTNIVAELGSLLAGQGASIDWNSLSQPFTLNIGGTFAPGSSPGRFRSGDLTLTSTSTLEIEIEGGSPGISYDQVDVFGTVHLQDATLSIFLAESFMPDPGQEFVIINNDSNDPVIGNFAGLPENAVLILNGQRFFISYVGGDGNDVVLRRNRLPTDDNRVGTYEMVEHSVEFGPFSEYPYLEFTVPGIDPDGDALTFSLVSPPSQYDLFEFYTDGTVRFRSTEHDGSQASFTYLVSDGELTSQFTETIELIPTADPPNLMTSDVVGDEGTPIPLSITSSLVDTDGSESLLITLRGIPQGTVLNRGFYDSSTGDWLVFPSELSGLTIESPDNQTFDIEVIATATESNQNGNFDTATTAETFRVTVNNVAPTLHVANHIAGSQLQRNWTDFVTVTDPGYSNGVLGTSETFTYTIQWGDGTSDDTGVVTIDHVGGGPTETEPSGLTIGSFDASHTFAADGLYNVTVTVTDDDGGTTSATFEVRVMIRLLDVEHSDEATVLLFTDPIDAASIDHNSLRIQGSQTGLANDTDQAIQVDGPSVTVPLIHRGFAGERFTVILPADRDEDDRTGVWSSLGNPIYQPEIDTQVVPATGGTGNWMFSKAISPGYVSAIGDVNRDQRLDFLTSYDDGQNYQLVRDDSAWEWNAEVFPSGGFNVQLIDADGDGVLEPVVGDSSGYWIDADFDLDGEQERFIVSDFNGVYLPDFEIDGIYFNPVILAENGSEPTAWQGLLEYSLGDFDGDGDIDIFFLRRNSQSPTGHLWLNPIRGHVAGNPTLYEVTSAAFDYAAIHTVADFNGDGIDDILFTSGGKVEIATLGTLINASTYYWPVIHTVASEYELRAVAAADFDGDQGVDILSLHGSDEFRMSWNDGAGNFTDEFFDAPRFITFGTVGDYNGDGTIDLMTDSGLFLNPPVSNAAKLLDDLEQYVATDDYNGAEFGRHFDFADDVGITFHHPKYSADGTFETAVVFWDRQPDGTWETTQTITPGWDFPNDFSASWVGAETIGVKIAGDHAGLLYKRAAYDEVPEKLVLQFYGRQSDGTWSKTDTFEWSSDFGAFDLDGNRTVVLTRNYGPEAGAVNMVTLSRNPDEVWSESSSYAKTEFKEFSPSISLDGSQLAVGSLLGDSLYSTGAVVFEDNGSEWIFRSELIDDGNRHNFGADLVLSNGVLAVRPGFDYRVELYAEDTIGTWQKVYESIEAVDSFDLQDGRLAVGRGTGFFAEESPGWFEVIKRDSQTGMWTQESFMPTPNPVRFDAFGHVQFGTNELWIGAPSVSSFYISSGYLYRLSFTTDSPTVPGTIQLDNSDPAFAVENGTWGTSSSIAGFLGTDYRLAGGGDKTARFTPTIVTGGTYEVLANWTSHPNRATNARYEIVHAEGTTVVTVDQTQNGGAFQSLGTFTFLAGQSGAVAVRTLGTNGSVVADAVRWVPVTATAIELDNSDSAFTVESGIWGTSSSIAGFVGTDYRFAGGGNKTARFTPTIAVGGTYEVFANWTSHPNRATNARYEIVHAEGTTVVTVDQTQNGGAFQSLGTFTFLAGQLGSVAVRTLGTNGSIVADSVRWVPVIPPPIAIAIELDNSAPAFTVESGIWGTSSSIAGFVGTDYRFAGGGNKTARFTPTIAVGGTYEVFANWTSHPNRATNARYEIVHAEGTTVVTVDQTQNGGVFQSLGTFTFFAGQAGSVSVRTFGANGSVVADAVRWVPVIATASAIELDNSAPAFAVENGIWGTSSSIAGFVGTDYRFAGGGDKTARFTPMIAVGGTYEVFATWTSHTNRATNARYDIVHAEGTDSVQVDQSQGGGTFQSLGTYHFEAGTLGSVAIRTLGTNGSVVADAIRMVPVQTPALSSFVMFTSETGHQNPLDVNGDDEVTPLDALLVLNGIQTAGTRGEGEETNRELREFDRLDTNLDGIVTPLDALVILNHISRSQKAGAEAEDATSKAGHASVWNQTDFTTLMDEEQDLERAFYEDISSQRNLF